MSDQILVGPVTTRKRHRLHLAASGRAHCGAGRGTILGGGQPLLAAHEPILCRRCIRAIRQAVTDAAQTAAAAEGNRYREDVVQDLAALGEALETPAQRLARARRHAEMVAQIRADLAGGDTLFDRLAATARLAPAVQARPEVARRRTWEDLRREFAEGHQRQLALTA